MTPSALPPKRGIFTQLPDAQFRSVVRKAQGFTDAQSALQAKVAKKTISSYIDSARQKLDFATTQDLIWAYFGEYAPVLLDPTLAAINTEDAA